MLLDFISFIKESVEDSRIRVSCAGLASIYIDGKYLLVQNKKSKSRGIINYGPLGGGLEYLPSGKEFLESLECKFERKEPDLRLTINVNHFQSFVDWFNTTDDREKSCKREVYEELVLEERILDNLDESDMMERKMDTIRDKSKRFGIMSERIFEIFEIRFKKEIEDEIIKMASYPDSTIRLISKEEILEGGREIATHAKFILK